MLINWTDWAEISSADEDEEEEEEEDERRREEIMDPIEDMIISPGPVRSNSIKPKVKVAGEERKDKTDSSFRGPSIDCSGSVFFNNEVVSVVSANPESWFIDNEV